MAGSITFDDKGFKEGLKRLETAVDGMTKKAAFDIATEILRLSQFVVPHDVGTLQNSGHTEPDGKDGQIVGYNTVYAARLHEHPEYRFQKGRQGKYLENPIKQNMSIFLKYVKDIVSGTL